MRDLARAAKLFERVLTSAKASAEREGFEWYPYPTLAGVRQIAPLLEKHAVLDTAAGLRIADVGCGDGDLAFFLESFGFKVAAVDHELTNYNQMRGVRALKAALRSSVEIHAADLDGTFHIPGGPFDLTLILGLLYHLKNPFRILEYAAETSHYALVSTRIARLTPQGRDIADEPLAYLVDSAELNADPTNYWIFSPAGLLRLLTRAGWTVCEFETTGGQPDSDPVNPRRDERAVCLLRSRITMGSRIELLDGWYAIENGTYRWTKRAFSVRLKEPALRGARLLFRFTLAPELMAAPVLMSAAADGIPLPSAMYGEPGRHSYTAAIPGELCGRPQIEIRFHGENLLQPVRDSRELGVLVSFWKEGLPTVDDNAPLELVY